jgi:hypothetical protein
MKMRCKENMDYDDIPYNSLVKCKEYRNRKCRSVRAVKRTLGHLDDKRGVRERECLKVSSILEDYVRPKLRDSAISLTGVGTSAPVTRSTGASR